MEPKKSRTDWDKSDTKETWQKLNANERKLYVACIKERLKKPPTKEVTDWLKQPELKEVKQLVMKSSGSPGGSPRGDSGEAKAVLAAKLTKQGFLASGDDVDSFKDDDWKRDWKKLPALHSMLHTLTGSSKHAPFAKEWLKDPSRKGIRLLVNNCEPIDYATLKGIAEADDPEKVANYSNLSPNDKAWTEGLRLIYKVKHLGSLGGPGGKRNKVEDV